MNEILNPPTKESLKDEVLKLNLMITRAILKDNIKEASNLRLLLNEYIDRILKIGR